MEQIQLSNATFEGDNNAYLFDGSETVLVDTGDWMPATRKQLSAALGDRGLGFGDVDRVFLTHWHGDHIGLAGAIQDASGAAVHVHEADAPLVAGDTEAWERMGETHEHLFEHWGMPASGRETLRVLFESSPSREDAPHVTPIQGGDTFSINGERVEAVHAPGHAAGLCLYDIGGDVLTGDALLPKYTPNVGGADVRVERPLERYLDTLERIAEHEYDRAWPGHRGVIDEPTARTEAITTHHRERAWRVLDALRRLGPTDVWTVSADLFGDLEGIHILHGPGEAHAHLQHLRRAGDVRRDDDQYRLVDGVPARLDEHADGDTGEWPLPSALGC
jgi:glyoxylase-like metal-dependent hydrolase (beta-lactamase superfamily II)